MAVIIPDGHFQLTVLWQSAAWQSGGGATVLGFRKDNALGMSSAAAQTLSRLVTNVVPLTTNTVRCVGARWASDVEGGLLLADAQGGLTSTVAAPNGSMLFRKQTGLRGRRGQGRAYWPYMASESDINDAGIVNATRLAAINNALATTVNAWTTDGVTQVLLQGEDGATPPYSPPPAVNGFFCDSKIATQRRRMRR